jgi:hypothetical protein
MPDDQTFEQRLESHVGGLVRTLNEGGNLFGKIGILLSAERVKGYSGQLVRIELFIDGRVLALFVYQSEIELIGAVDV